MNDVLAARVRSPPRPIAEHEGCGHAVRIGTVIDRPRVVVRFVTNSAAHAVIMPSMPAYADISRAHRGLGLCHRLRNDGARQAGDESNSESKSDPSRHDDLRAQHAGLTRPSAS